MKITFDRTTPSHYSVKLNDTYIGDIYVVESEPMFRGVKNLNARRLIEIADFLKGLEK